MIDAEYAASAGKSPFRKISSTRELGENTVPHGSTNQEELLRAPSCGPPTHVTGMKSTPLLLAGGGSGVNSNSRMTSCPNEETVGTPYAPLDSEMSDIQELSGLPEDQSQSTQEHGRLQDEGSSHIKERTLHTETRENAQDPVPHMSSPQVQQQKEIWRRRYKTPLNNFTPCLLEVIKAISVLLWAASRHPDFKTSSAVGLATNRRRPIW